MKHAIPEMRKRGGGSIISTASIAGLQGYPGLHPYCAAKAAVVNLTRSAAVELGKDPHPRQLHLPRRNQYAYLHSYAAEPRAAGRGAPGASFSPSPGPGIPKT